MLTAALALVALPGLAGSRAPNPVEPVPAVAFQQLTVPADESRSTASIGPLDDAFVSAAQVDAGHGYRRARRRRRPRGHLPGARRAAPARGIVRAQGSTRRPVRDDHGAPKKTLTGDATFYANGTTAMRLPRGTVVRICGAGGCLDAGRQRLRPARPSKNRIIDLYTPDFFRICGCPSWSGTTR